MTLLKEFREFAVKGNAIDMAIGIVIGVSFNNIVNSLVNDLLMPPLGFLIGGVEFKHLEIVLKHASTGPAGETVPQVAIRYGAFVNTVIEFLLIALSAFVVVKVMNRIIRRRTSEGGA